jgi:hypothetical protein
MDDLQKEKPFDEIVVEVIEEEAAKYEVTVDYYIMEFL